MTDKTTKRITTWAPIVLAVLTLVGGGLAWAMSTDARVTKLETHREHDAKDIASANEKLDFLIERLIK